MSEELRSVIAWLGVWFLSLELSAHFHLNRWQLAIVLLAATATVIALWPIFTLSGTGWGGILWWSFVGVIIALFLAVLLGHLEWHWSARWLIAFAAASGFVIASHALERAIHRS